MVNDMLDFTFSSNIIVKLNSFNVVNAFRTTEVTEIVALVALYKELGEHTAAEQHSIFFW